VSKNKEGDVKRGLRDRRGEILFIDARSMGTLVDRVHRELTDGDLQKIAGTYHAWRSDKSAKKYQDTTGFCKSTIIEDVVKHGYLLTPGRFVGAEVIEADDEPFEAKIERLVAELDAQFEQAGNLEKLIKHNLKRFGHD
jgi:type I restriction enzyme M protein